jgi:hypothetical protein
MTLPRFLLSPDPDRDPGVREQRRDQYAQRGRQDRALILNEGTIYAEPLDLDTALQMFERLATEMLPPRDRRWTP